MPARPLSELAAPLPGALVKLWRARAPTQFSVDSFDDFLRDGIPACLARLPPAEVGPYSVTFANPRLLPPSHTEADGVIRAITPSEAHERKLDYHSILLVDVFDRGVRVLTREPMGYVPIMVGSAYPPDDPRRDDYGGFFIIKGQLRVPVPPEVQRYNASILRRVKTGWTCDVNSDGTPSRLTIALSNKSVVTVAMHKHISAAFTLAHFFRALGDARPLHDILTRPGDDAELLNLIRRQSDDADLAALAAKMTYFAPGKERILMSQYLLPHLGTRAEDWPQKVFWLAQWTRELFMCALGRVPVTDRDHLANRRARIVGVLMEELFGRALNAFRNKLRERLNKFIGKNIEVKLTHVLGSARSELTSIVHTALLTGRFGQKRQGFTCPLEIHVSSLSALSVPRHTKSFFAKQGAVLQARELHGSHYGFICPAEAPDGDNIGFLKTLAATAELTAPGNDAFWAAEIASVCVPWHPALDRVMLNGRIFGAPRESLDFAFAHLRAAVRRDPPFHAIVLKRNNEVLVDTSPGRWVRPVYVAPFHDSTHPFLLELSFEKLIAQGYLEYIDPAVDAAIAPTPADLSIYHTHVEVHPALFFGHSAGRVPFAEHDAAARISFQANMGRRSVGRPSLAPCWESSFYLLEAPQWPLMRTDFERVLNPAPACVNLIVAMVAFSKNQEDSLAFSQRAIDLGAARVVKNMVVDETAHAPDVFCRPPASENGPPLKDIDGDGIISPGVRVQPGGVLACRKLARGSFVYTYLPGKESAIVQRVLYTTAPDHSVLVRIKLSIYRQPVVGDKFSSRHGQKGVLSAIIPAVNMPFTRDGITPDVCVNPHALPSRMTIAHMIESLVGKAETLLPGTRSDPTPFSAWTPDAAERMLERAGFHRSGREAMYCGNTGEMLEARIFIGIVPYQRQPQQVADKLHARGYGAMNAITGQPIGGRANDGAGRMGDMEYGAAIAHGASEFVLDRSVGCSDGVLTAFCCACGLPALRTIGVPDLELVCSRRTCDSRSFEKRMVPRTSLLFQGKLAVIGVDVAF